LILSVTLDASTQASESSRHTASFGLGFTAVSGLLFDLFLPRDDQKN
jgi:hypothetical protein